MNGVGACPRIACLLALFMPLLLIMPSSITAGERLSQLGLPTVPLPVENPLSPQKIALGKKLFFDTRLSADGAVSCASCHQPERAFTDGLPLARGLSGRTGTRNTPSLINVAFNRFQFWDGRQPDLETQAIEPFFNLREHGLPDEHVLLNIVRRDRGYAAAFRAAFQGSPDAIGIEQIARALASFERTLVAGNSSFDRYEFAHETSALTAGAVRGLALFRGSARCATCHTIGTESALFSDDQFHSVSNGLRPLGPRLAALASGVVRDREGGTAIDQRILSDGEVAQLGRFLVTLNPVDIGKFRTPSLRNVASTAPYMHDGSVATLAEAVELELYYRGVEAGHPLILTPHEKDDLVEFLNALGSPKTAALPHRVTTK